MFIRTPEDAAALLSPMLAHGAKEVVVTAHLDSGQRLIAVTVGEPGECAAVDLPVRALLAMALRVGADSVVVAHNHPSGDPTPSKADRAATRALAKAAKVVGIRIHDHLIFAGEDYRSFLKLGLL
jgi:DNA repair protein RadC